MRWARVRRKALVVALTLPAFLLAGCTLGSMGSGLPVGTTSATESVTPLATPPVTPTSSDDELAASWESTVNYAGTGTQAGPVHVRLQPLVRIQDGVLLTVELNLADGASSTGVFAPFCTGESCGDLSGISLIDTVSRTRFGPLRSGLAGPMMTSSVRSFSMKPGMTYQFGALFADPGTASVAVDLQQAGVALAVPITTGFPVANLISTQPPPADGWDPQPVTAGTMVTAPIPAIEGSFDQIQNQRGLVAKIVGEPVNAAPGMVTLSSDRLFRTGAATFRPAAAALITRAASVVAAQADPSQPVSVVAFTDPAGTTGLTIAQARVVASQLAGRLKQFTLLQAGAGSADPLAANTTSTGQASTQGQALNRRIELSFTPQDAGDVPPVSTLATPSPGVTPPLSATPSSLATPSRLATPSVTGAASPAGPRVGPAAVEPGTNARFTAEVEPVQVDGTMTLVRLQIRSDANANPVGAFSALGGKRTDVGAFNVADRTTGRVYVPMSDAGNPARVTGIFTHRFTRGVTYEYTFFVAALPAGLTTVDVGLAGLGTAQSVPVSR